MDTCSLQVTTAFPAHSTASLPRSWLHLDACVAVLAQRLHLLNADKLANQSNAALSSLVVFVCLASWVLGFPEVCCPHLEMVLFSMEQLRISLLNSDQQTVADRCSGDHVPACTGAISRL